MAQFLRSRLPNFKLPSPSSFFNKLQLLYKPPTSTPNATMRGAGKSLLARAQDASPYSIPVAIGRANVMRRARERLARLPGPWSMEVDKPELFYMDVDESFDMDVDERFDMDVDTPLPISHLFPVAVVSGVAPFSALAPTVPVCNMVMASAPPPQPVLPTVASAPPPAPAAQPPQPLTTRSALPSSSNAFFPRASTWSRTQAPQAAALAQNPSTGNLNSSLKNGTSSVPRQSPATFGSSPKGYAQHGGTGGFGTLAANTGLASTSGALFASSSWYLRQAQNRNSASVAPPNHTSAAFSTWRSSPSDSGGRNQHGSAAGVPSLAGRSVLQAPLPSNSGAFSLGAPSVSARRNEALRGQDDEYMHMHEE